LPVELARRILVLTSVAARRSNLPSLIRRGLAAALLWPVLAGAVAVGSAVDVRAQAVRAAPAPAGQALPRLRRGFDQPPLLIARNAALTPNDVRRILTGTAKQLGPPGRTRDFGAGLVDAARAVGSASR
jgi:hypothetical protein